ncbi:MAG: DUF1501 domain-containing protein [Planctomycetes bacterium]|nr:DUF1501 domain-containing protein [Planctomycetota bacterium]
MPLPSLLNRRDLLCAGGVSAAATLLGPGVPFANAAAGPKAKSVIFLWLAGGVTHHESFDPKPDAPQEIRGSLTTIQTTLPGVRFSEVMPRMANQTDKIALVRTFASGTDDHFQAQARALSGRMVNLIQIDTEPNIGSVMSKLNGPRGGFPGYIAVPGTTRPGPPPKNLFVGGWLGRQYGPFMTGGKAKNEDFTAGVKEDVPEEEFTKQAVQPSVGLTDDRLAGRSSLRAKLDRALKHSEPASAVADEFRGAFDMLLSPTVRAAFDLSKETDKTRDLYGKTRIGTRCLLARRLVEAGAPFVMVDYGYDPEYGNLWDQHNAVGQNFPHICEMAKRPYHLAGVDRAFAALLEDLASRGRLDQTLVVFLTDFGRTPKINKDGGRDHWGRTGSIFFAGGGVKGGQVIGATDSRGADPVTAAYTPADTAATVYEALGVDLGTVLNDREGREIPMLPVGRPIKGVL